MRLLGVLGGMSWTSTAEYYRLLNDAVARRLGGLHSARLLVHSVDFAEVDALQRADDWPGMGQLLAEAAKGLQAGGAEGLLMAANTMHRVSADIAAAVDIPFFHIADAIAQRVEQTGQKRIGLLASSEEDFYDAPLAAKGITLLRPDEVEQADVTRIIYEELVHGLVRTGSRKRFRQVMARMDADGADGIICADTEIQLLVHTEDADVPLYSSTQIHVEDAVNWMLG